MTNENMEVDIIVRVRNAQAIIMAQQLGLEDGLGNENLEKLVIVGLEREKLILKGASLVTLWLQNPTQTIADLVRAFTIARMETLGIKPEIEE